MEKEKEKEKGTKRKKKREKRMTWRCISLCSKNLGLLGTR